MGGHDGTVRSLGLLSRGDLQTSEEPYQCNLNEGFCCVFSNNVSPHSDDYKLSWGGAILIDVRGGGVDVQNSQFYN